MTQQRAFRAMGCDMALFTTARDPSAARQLEAVHAMIHRLEERLSRFRDSSELCRLNRADGPVAVSDDLWGVLVDALDAARRTRGLYDPTILSA